MLDIEITRQDNLDTQVKCTLNGDLLPEFFSFDSSTQDSDIKSQVNSTLQELGYSI